MLPIISVLLAVILCFARSNEGQELKEMKHLINMLQEKYGELKVKIGEKDTEHAELRKEVEVLKMQLKEKDKELSGFEKRLETIEHSKERKVTNRLSCRGDVELKHQFNKSPDDIGNSFLNSNDSEIIQKDIRRLQETAEILGILNDEGRKMVTKVYLLYNCI